MTGPMRALEGKIAVITGGARKGGIGRGIAERLLRDGASVVISDLGHPLDSHPDYHVAPSEDLLSAEAELGKLGPVLSVACDVRDEDQVAELYRHTVVHFGRLDIAVNGAGLAIGLKTLTEVSLRDWQANLEVMATGTFLCCRAAARMLKKQAEGGRIINIASQAGKTGMPLMSAYCSAKFAVIGLTQSAAAELGPDGITVNAICPGTIETPLLHVPGGVYDTYSSASGHSEASYKARLVKQIPVRRFGTPGDIASAVAYLASDEAAFVTGEALNVTGGQEVH